jgi:hypothetical protein
MLKTRDEKELEVLIEQRKLIDSQQTFFDTFANDKPEWWTAQALRQIFIDAKLIEDTRTPRASHWGDTTSSRLELTMARHRAMDGQLAGKRRITSAWRNTNLGSMNSDHVTGRAYDLVGNQLGMYKTTVERNGGFAEFHGGSLNRHLHVVPGPVAGVGDRSNPYMSDATMSSLQTSTNAATAAPSRGIVVNNYFNGANPDELVNKAVNAFYRIEQESKYRR